MRFVRVKLKHAALPGLALGLFAASACDGKPAGVGETVLIGTTSDAETLFPPLAALTTSRAITDLLFDKLAELGPSLNTLGDIDFRPRLAERWDWSHDSLAITFHLNPLARWHDGQPVRAGDVRFAFSVYRDPLVGARGGGDLRAILDSISVGDSATCTAWFKQRNAEQFNTLVGTLVPLPEHLLGRTPADSLRTSPFARDPVGNGAFRFARWEPQQRIELTANLSYYRGRPALDRVIWTVAPQMTTLVQQLLVGEVDFVPSLTPEDAAAAARRPDIRVLRLGSYDYGVAQLNLRDGASDRPHPLFSDRRMRRALTMALDRRTMIRSAYGALAATALGPFVRAQWSADTTLDQLPFNRANASRLLDSLGWPAGADGMRARAGRPLAFTLLVPSSSKPRQAFAVLLQEQFRQTGVQADIELLDFSAFDFRWRSRKFDVAILKITTTPSPTGLRQTWTSSAAREGGFNEGRYQNPEFDAFVDSAVTDVDRGTATRHYRRAYQTIVDDAPALWLFEAPELAGASSRLRIPAARADAWWTGIPAWSVPSGGRRQRAASPAPKP